MRETWIKQYREKGFSLSGPFALQQITHNVSTIAIK